MPQPDTDIETNAPINKSWADDWAKAEAAAEAHEASKRGDSHGENEGEQEGQRTADGGANDDGTQDTEVGGEEGGLESSSEAADRSGESRQRTQDGDGGVEGDADERERRVSRQGREQRDGGEPSQEGSVEEGEPDGPVTVQERVRFREERRELRQKFEQREQELRERYDRAVSGLEEKYSQAATLQAALDGGDYDEIAKAAGYDDFGAMSVAAVQRSMSPDQQEMIKLRRELQKEKREREQWAERQRATRAQQQQERHVSDYKADLKSELRAFEDTTVSTFANEDSFVDMVFEMQKRHWDDATEQTISAADAAELVMGELRPAYERMHKVFGGRAASQPEKQPASVANAETPRRRPPTTVSHSEAVDASGAELETELDNDAWARKWSKQLANSQAVS